MAEQIGFGDQVRIVESPETAAAGVAGLTGPVWGFSVPSSSGVEVIGERGEDFAYNVAIEERDDAVWLAPHLVEIVEGVPRGSVSLSRGKRTVRFRGARIALHPRIRLADDDEWLPLESRRERLAGWLRGGLDRMSRRGRDPRAAFVDAVDSGDVGLIMGYLEGPEVLRSSEREMLIEALALLGAVRELVGYLDDGNEDLRSAAARALSGAAIESADVAHALLAVVLRPEEDHFVQREALLSLAVAGRADLVAEARRHGLSRFLRSELDAFEEARD
jgi:hypothetical protein